MKIKTLRTYQSVRFNQKDETHFDNRIPRFANIDIDYDAKMGAVRIAMEGTDTVYVFSTNIAYVTPEEHAEVKLTKAK